MSEIILTSKIIGAKEKAKGLSDVTVKTGRVFVGAAEHDETDYTEAQNVEVGVFMDGTWNNRNNTEARKEYEKMQRGQDHNRKLALSYINDDIASFENEYSNVARMEPYYKEDATEKLVTFPVYIEGVGTENYQEDSTRGGGFGTGDTGIRAKMVKACEEIVTKIKWYNLKEINNLTVDVFGFSRGATAARHLIHELFKPYRPEQAYYRHNGAQSIRMTKPAQPRRGHFGKVLGDKNISLRMLTVRFVGLYDTVSAHGLGVAFDYDNDTEALNLDAIRKARFTLQLIAGDEHRRNFSLVNIDSAVSAGRGEEYTLPGVHADVGGSYVGGKEEVRMFDYKDWDYVLEQGWYTSDQINIITKELGRGPTFRYIKGTRTLPNTYSHIPLTIMADKMMEKELPLKLNQLKAKYSIPSDLKDEKERIFKYVFGGGPPLEFRPVEELNQQLARGTISRKTHRRQLQDSVMLMKLRNNYLHYSARFRGVVNTPRSGRQREINDG